MVVYGSYKPIVNLLYLHYQIPDPFLVWEINQHGKPSLQGLEGCFPRIQISEVLVEFPHDCTGERFSKTGREPGADFPIPPMWTGIHDQSIHVVLLFTPGHFFSSYRVQSIVAHFCLDILFPHGLVNVLIPSHGDIIFNRYDWRWYSKSTIYILENLWFPNSSNKFYTLILVSAPAASPECGHHWPLAAHRISPWWHWRFAPLGVILVLVIQCGEAASLFSDVGSHARVSIFLVANGLYLSYFKWDAHPSRPPNFSMEPQTLGLEDDFCRKPICEAPHCVSFVFPRVLWWQAASLISLTVALISWDVFEGATQRIQYRICDDF